MKNLGFRFWPGSVVSCLAAVEVFLWLLFRQLSRVDGTEFSFWDEMKIVFFRGEVKTGRLFSLIELQDGTKNMKSLKSFKTVQNMKDITSGG